MSGEPTAPSWIQGYLEAINSHDGAKVTSFMTDDVVLTDFALDERFEGPQAVSGFIEDTAETFSTDYSFTASQVVLAKDSYAYEWTMAGTNDRADEKRGLPSTGKHFEFPGVSIGRLRDGKIYENHDYWNMATLLTQLLSSS